MRAVVCLTPKDVQAGLNGGQETTHALLVDVRTPDEFARGSVPGACNIPLDTLPEKISLFDRARDIITICHHGRRSLQAAEFLCAQGFCAKSMSGGMDAWALTIDPRIERY